MAAFGPKYNFLWRGQKLWYPHVWKPPSHLVHIAFWSGMGSNGLKGPIFRPKMPNLAVFGPKNILGEGRKREPMRHLLCVETLTGEDPMVVTAIFSLSPSFFCKNRLFFYFAHFTLQCQEHGVCQNVHLPKIGPIQPILAQNLIFPIFIYGRLLANAWRPFLDPFWTHFWTHHNFFFHFQVTACNAGNVFFSKNLYRTSLLDSVCC